MACPDCFSGHVDSGKPLGRIEKVHGRETYIAEPTDGQSPKGIIIIIHDAFGLPFLNNQILADHYAASGQYLVYLPDFMDGGNFGILKTISINKWYRKTCSGRTAPSHEQSY